MFDDLAAVAGADESFFARSQACYIPSSSDELDRSGRFGPATFRRYEWEQSSTTASHIQLLLTYSGHRALDPRLGRASSTASRT